jgi:hypothetical protein
MGPRAETPVAMPPRPTEDPFITAVNLNPGWVSEKRASNCRTISASPSFPTISIEPSGRTYEAPLGKATGRGS